MSKKLSIVLASRDDNYGDDVSDGIYDLNFTPLKNIERTKISIENNINLFDEHAQFDFEFIVVDWSPKENKFLYKNSELEELLSNPNIRNIIVEPSAVKKAGLSENGFNEYFAKNVGIRNALGEYILVINSDGLLSQKLVKEINLVINSDENDYFFRPHSRIDIDANYQQNGEGLSFYDSTVGFNIFKKALFNKTHKLDLSLNLDKKEFKIDSNFYNLIGGSAAGDFTLSHRKNFIDISTGYFEDLKNPIGENFRQSSRDGQILVNFVLHGIYPKKFKNSIKSFDHNKIERVGAITFNAYRNHKNWGFNDYERYELDGNTFIT
jgi:hypothetical protein